MIAKQKTCCCCDGDAGKYFQHWNRDDGYGICKSCLQDEIKRGISESDITSLYGKPGINYEHLNEAVSS